MNLVQSCTEAEGGHIGVVAQHKFLGRAGKEQTQGLDARSLFRERDGRVEPALQPLQVPVRAVVLHVGDLAAARTLSSTVERHLSPLAQDAGLWLQDPSKYHATLFHASAHEVRATLEFGGATECVEAATLGLENVPVPGLREANGLLLPGLHAVLCLRAFQGGGSTSGPPALCPP